MDELQKFLDTAKGTIQIEVNGSKPHITGNGLNDAGMVMASLGMLKCLEEILGLDLKDVCDTIIELDSVMDYKVAQTDELKGLL